MTVLRAHKVTLGVFLAMILAFRVLVPAGWMPSEAKDKAHPMLQRASVLYLKATW